MLRRLTLLAFLLSACILRTTAADDAKDIVKADEAKPHVIYHEIEEDDDKNFAADVDAFYEEHGHSLDEMLAQDDDSLLLAGYWRQLNDPIVQNSAFDSHLIEYNRYKFLGLLTQRTGAAPPRWWERSLLQQRLHVNRRISDWYNYYIDVSPDGHRSKILVPELDDKFPKFEKMILAPNLTFVRREERHDVFLVGKREARIRTDDLRRVLEHTVSYGGISMAPLKHGTAILLSDTLFFDGEIIFADQGGNVKWSTMLWGADSTASPLGAGLFIEYSPTLCRGFHYFQVRQAGDKLLFYGADISSAYIECLRISDGKPLFHFNTSSTRPQK